MQHNIIADFRSKLFFKDFDFSDWENHTLDEKTVLMIFCSYHTNQATESTESSSHNKDD